jgi:hypothetical protein
MLKWATLAFASNTPPLDGTEYLQGRNGSEKKSENRRER